MKPIPNRYRAVGELTPVIQNCSGVPNLVSVLVSVADPLTPNPLLHPQLGMEPVVGLGPTTDGLQNLGRFRLAARLCVSRCEPAPCCADDFLKTEGMRRKTHKLC